MPAEYARNLLDDEKGPYPETPSQDEKHALATVKHYRSLVPMAQEARKPIFHLTPGRRGDRFPRRRCARRLHRL